nr:hypothetical protein [Tanacetum cinerariifolium]
KRVSDQTPPPRDESSDYVSSDSESEDEEADIAPEATAGTVAQRPFAIHDFPRGIVEVRESSAARDSSYVGGLAPWALRRDLETSRARDRLTEAELSTTQAEIALLKSKNKIGEKERKLLDHDLRDVERTFSIVLERLKVLESGENATLKKKLAEKEMQLVIARMDHASVKWRLHEFIGWNRRFYMEMVRKGAVPKPSFEDKSTECPRKKSKKPSFDETEGPFEPRGPPSGSQIMPPKAMSGAQMRKIIRDQVTTSMAEFMANMNHGTGDARTDGAEAGGAGTGGAETGGAGTGGAEAGGAGPAVPEITGCTYVTFMKCNPQPFKGTKGDWFEKLEFVFRISDCKEKDKVKFATAILQGRALTWWNGRIASMGIDAANGTPWTELKGTDIDRYTNRFPELALLCPRMVEPEQVKVEQYIRRLSKNIRGDVTSSKPAGEKRKGEGDRGGHGDNRHDYNCRQNQRRANDGAMTNVALNDNETVACRCLDRKDVTCFNCNEKGHLKRDCPKLKKNGQGENNHGVVYKLGAVDAQQDPKVVTGSFLLNNRYATSLFDSGANKSFVSTKFSTLIYIEPVELDTFYDIELADGKVNLEVLIIIGMDWLSRYDAAILCGKRKARKYIENGCELFLAQVTKQGSKEKRLEDVLVIRDFPEVFPDELPGLSPPRQVEFRIDLIPSDAPVARAPYRLAPSKMKELSEKLQELSEKGFIRLSSSPWGASILFVKKKDRSFRMCIDYR